MRRIIGQLAPPSALRAEFGTTRLRRATISLGLRIGVFSALCFAGTKFLIL